MMSVLRKSELLYFALPRKGLIFSIIFSRNVACTNDLEGDGSKTCVH